jgi:hypothetical protein
VGDIVNMRLARKARSRARHEAEAATKRALHGRTKAQKQADQAEQQRLTRNLDGVRIDES